MTSGCPLWPRPRFVVYAFGALALGLSSSLALAQGKVQEGTIKGNVWSFGVTGGSQNLQASGDNQISGYSGTVQIGSGYIARNWLLDISVDIVQGPYAPIHNGQLSVDYTGYGGTIWTGIAASEVDLRSHSGGYGFAIGLNYNALTGQMTGRNHLDDGQNTAYDRGLINTYVIHTSNFSVEPGLFFTWFTSGRPHGNTPDLLLTRLEGYVLILSVATPVVATYNTSYTYGNNMSGSDHGNLSGYTLQVTVKAMLGT